MSAIELLVSQAVLIAAIAVIAPILGRPLGLPDAALQILGGAGAAALLTGPLGIDTGLRADNFETLVFCVFLPPILLAATTRTDESLQRRDALPAATLSLLSLLTGLLVISLVTYVAMDSPRWFPPVLALLLAAMLLETDPHAIDHSLRRYPGGPRVLALLQVESLISEIAAVIAFTLLIELALMHDLDQPALMLGKQLLWSLSAGLVVGVVAGPLAVALARAQREVAAKSTVSILMAYAAFTVAQTLLEGSGAVAVVTSGIIFARWRRAGATAPSAALAQIGHLAYGCLFTLSGFTITLAMFRERWLAMLIAIAAVALARIVCVAIYSLWERRRGVASSDLADPLLLYSGSVRGAVTLALALSLPTELPVWWTLQSMAFGVVLFGFFVQLPLVRLLRKPVSERKLSS